MATKTKRKTKLRTRTIGLLVGLGIAVIGGGIAFAYFTNVGAGTGAAGTGSNNPVVVKQTSAVTLMAPGVAPQALSGNFDNTNNPGPVFIQGVTATISSVTVVVPSPAPSPPPPACTVTDFVIAGGTPVPPNGAQSAYIPIGPGGAGVEIPAGSAQGSWSGLTLQFNNKATNQDACKNSTVNITYAAK
jgi:hypothetical protein